MAPAYVKPYFKRNKTDSADAEAIAEAMTRPTMRFVAIKLADQQAALMLYRTREMLVRSAQSWPPPCAPTLPSSELSPSRGSTDREAHGRNSESIPAVS